MNLSELIAGTGASVVRGDPSVVRICDVTEDSRTVMPGSLFIARRGTRADGRAHVGEACEQGAVAIVSDDAEVCSGGVCERGAHHRAIDQGVALVITPDVPRVSAIMAERFYGNPSSRLRMVGVTGTNGKTTIVHLVHQALNACAVRTGMIGTVQIDDGRETAAASMTTPPAVEVSRTLASMVEFGCVACAMETSSHALDQGRVAAVRFGVGVFTNLTGDHLDYHKTMEAYADAKARLFASLPESGVAIVNAEDPAHERMLRDCRANVFRCVTRPLTPAERSSGWCSIVVRERSVRGTTADIVGPWSVSGEPLTVTYHLIGDHNAMNVLQAFAAAWVIGREFRLTHTRLAESLSGVTAPCGRLERVGPERAGEPIVLVDYAHTDDGLRKALEAVRSVMGAGTVAGGRLWVVFGAGGDKDKAKRPRMGRAAWDLADRIVVTSDNPRRESPSEIIDQILSGMERTGREDRVTVQADRREAIYHAVANAGPGDVVLIAGKGHETEQVLSDGRGGTRTTRFVDQEVASEALAARARSEEEK